MESFAVVVGVDGVVTLSHRESRYIVNHTLSSFVTNARFDQYYQLMYNRQLFILEIARAFAHVGGFIRAMFRLYRNLELMYLASTNSKRISELFATP